MKKASRIASILIAIALLLSVNTLAGFAAEQKRVEIADSKGGYLTVTNVTEVKQAGYFPLFVAQSPVTVTIYGDDICREFISYFIDSKVVSDGVQWGDFDESIKFDVMKYRYYDSDTIYDMYTQPPEDIVLYASGNKATLTKPGYYIVSAAPEAAEGADVLIHITGEATAEPKPSTTPEPKPSTTPVPQPTQPETVKVKPTPSKVLVDGKAISFEAYGINGFNYFKLRDLAMAVSGTTKQFDVAWDAANNAIKLTSGKAYTVAGGELVVSANFTEKEAKTTPSKILADGSEIELTAYGIAGYNYFKLRDIGKLFDFGVEWDAKNNAVIIDTTKPYVD